MAGNRIPGPVGRTEGGVQQIDGGTGVRWRTPAPGVVGPMSAVVAMPVEIRFKEVLWRTLPLLPKELREEFLAFLSPASVAIMAGTLVAWSGSHAFGVGFIADGVMAVVGIAFLGVQFYTSAADLVEAVTLTVEASAPEDLDRAAAALARFVSVVGIAVTTALLLKIGRRAAVVAVSRTALLESGMTAEHFAAFRRVAAREKRIIAMRNTNPKSTPLIAKGCPSKPLIIKSHTDQATGVVTVRNLAEEVEAFKAGYYVVDAEGIPRRGVRTFTNGKENVRPGLQWDENPFWDLRPGQVIDPMVKKPLVGDYDALGIFDPMRPQNLAVIVSDGAARKNISTPEIDRIVESLNTEMRSMRVLHGAHDQWIQGGSIEKIKDFAKGVDSATVFYPDGSVEALVGNEAVVSFYGRFNRKSLFVLPPERPPADVIPIGRGRK